MKATGIIRPVDELGRVVIPVELRRVNGIEVGDRVEIFTDQGGQIIMRKFMKSDAALATLDALRRAAQHIPDRKRWAQVDNHLDALAELLSEPRV